MTVLRPRPHWLRVRHKPKPLTTSLRSEPRFQEAGVGLLAACCRFQLSIPAVALAVGALAFLAWTLRGSARELSTLVSGVRLVGVVIAVGALTEYLGSIAAPGESFATGWADTPGRAMVLRLVGAILLVAGLRATTIVKPASINPRPKTLSAAVIDDPVSVHAGGSPRQGPGRRERWDRGSSKVAVAWCCALRRVLLVRWPHRHQGVAPAARGRERRACRCRQHLVSVE
jgi:hypothetical protein